MAVDEVSDSSRRQLQDALLDLGFSQYEARCYVGLLGAEGMTGYAVANATGVPQPKVYETLRKLARRGAAQQVGDDPVLFLATPPSELLKDLDAQFRERYDLASRAAESIRYEDRTTRVANVRTFRTRDVLMSTTISLIGDARRRIYLSASVDEVDALLPALRAAVERGTDVVLLDFGSRTLQERGMQVFRHASTDRAIYRHHRARHLALVVDSVKAINAIAVDGENWDGVLAEHAAIIAAVKGLIRHDIDLQQVYADFGPTLVEAYGPGLQMLEVYRGRDASMAEDLPAEARTPRPASRRVGS